MDYDVVVIGGGPAGLSGAITAARMGKRAALVERNGRLGGVCTNTGTIPVFCIGSAALDSGG